MPLQAVHEAQARRHIMSHVTSLHPAEPAARAPRLTLRDWNQQVARCSLVTSFDPVNYGSKPIRTVLGQNTSVQRKEDKAIVLQLRPGNLSKWAVGFVKG